jgi:hypothetical protein
MLVRVKKECHFFTNIQMDTKHCRKRNQTSRRCISVIILEQWLCYIYSTKLFQFWLYNLCITMPTRIDVDGSLTCDASGRINTTEALIVELVYTSSVFTDLRKSFDFNAVEGWHMNTSWCKSSLHYATAQEERMVKFRRTETYTWISTLQNQSRNKYQPFSLS